MLDTMNTRIQIAMPTSIRLSPEAEKRLDFLAAQTGRTKAFYLRQMIENGLDDLEDYYLAADVLERVRQGKEKVHSSATVRRDVGLED
jgi:RHH-type rel operon transcriptional repressor/antitoxin RelB